MSGLQAKQVLMEQVSEWEIKIIISFNGTVNKVSQHCFYYGRSFFMQCSLHFNYITCVYHSRDSLLKLFPLSRLASPSNYSSLGDDLMKFKEGHSAMGVTENFQTRFAAEKLPDGNIEQINKSLHYRNKWLKHQLLRPKNLTKASADSYLNKLGLEIFNFSSYTSKSNRQNSGYWRISD